MILYRYYKLFKINASGTILSKYLLNSTIYLVAECARLSDHRRGYLTFAPCAGVLILIFSVLIKTKEPLSGMCNSRCRNLLN